MAFSIHTHFDQLPASADQLLTHSARNSAFLTLAWFTNLTSFRPGDAEQLALATVTKDARTLAILPLTQATGIDLAPLSHRYASQFSVLLADEDRQATLDCLAQGLADMGIRSLLLEPVDLDDPAVQGFQHGMASHGFSANTHFRFYNWVHRVDGQSFAEYLADRPPRLRNTLARKRRKLAREQDMEMRLFIGAEVPDAMTDYHAVYDASWKANEQFRPFVDGLVERFSAEGWTRLGVLYIQGRPAAAQLWFVVHDKAYIFRLAYDQAWKQYSVGSILTAHLMEHVIDTDKVEEIDFLVGNEAYKQDWMSERRERWALGLVRQLSPGSWRQRLVDPFRNMFGNRSSR